MTWYGKLFIGVLGLFGALTVDMVLFPIAIMFMIVLDEIETNSK